MKVTLLTHTPEPEKLIAAAAKLCYASAEIDELLRNLTPEKTASFIAHLESLGHESPFEHASFTFGIEGVSRALLPQPGPRHPHRLHGAAPAAAARLAGKVPDLFRHRQPV